VTALVVEQLALDLAPKRQPQPVKPFLKWAGGKRQLLPDLVEHLPETYGRYIEPFLGGGALFFHLRPLQVILADFNGNLIDTYKVVRDSVEDLIQELAAYPNDEAFYYEIRRQHPENLPLVKRAAREIFLNKTCFNGLYRVNRNGRFNVPFGRRRNPNICDGGTLRTASGALQSAELVHGDYKLVLRELARSGDFIFLDPPYYPAGGFADFNRFTSEYFYEEDHVELRDEVERLVELGCHVLLTNSNTEFVRRLYDRFEYRVTNAHRKISSNPKTRLGEDLIVVATRARKRATRAGGPDGDLLRNFPGTRFMGSKYRVLPFIREALKDVRFGSVLDAFSGSACVSYMFKEMGKRVISNDFMNFSYHLARATIENSDVELSDADVTTLLSPNEQAGRFIQDTFRGLYFEDHENQFLDSLRANVDLLRNPTKKSLAISAICRACLKKRPRGVFTYIGTRYQDGRQDLKLSLQEHFMLNVQAFNKAVLDNGQTNQALNHDVFDLEVQPDLVYLDPPYYTPHSDNEYIRRYHFIEGLARRWEGLEIQQDTKTRKFKKYYTPFSDPRTVKDAFLQLFQKFADSILVVSYSSNGIPSKSELVDMLKSIKKSVSVHQVDHTYSFGTHGHLPANGTSRVTEYIFVAR
jgi:DNA adenine methylase